MTAALLKTYMCLLKPLKSSRMEASPQPQPPTVLESPHPIRARPNYTQCRRFGTAAAKSPEASRFDSFNREKRAFCRSSRNSPTVLETSRLSTTQGLGVFSDFYGDGQAYGSGNAWHHPSIQAELRAVYGLGAGVQGLKV